MPPLWSSAQSSWLQIQGSGFDSRRYQIFWEVVGLERGPLSLSLVSTGGRTDIRERCRKCHGPASTYTTSSAVRVARSVRRNVTTDRSRSTKTLVGTSQINSPASLGFTEQHASPSELHWRATLPAVFQASTPSADFNYKSPGHRNRPPTSNIKELHITQVVYLQSVSIKVHTLCYRVLIVGIRHHRHFCTTSNKTNNRSG
jgi:hypothetical protein